MGILHKNWQTARSIGRERRHLAAQFAQRIAGGSLFGLFLIATPGRLIAIAGDLSGHLEALAVIGALFVQELVGRGRAVFPLSQLLKQRLVVAPAAAVGRK